MQFFHEDNSTAESKKASRKARIRSQSHRKPTRLSIESLEQRMMFSLLPLPDASPTLVVVTHGQSFSLGGSCDSDGSWRETLRDRSADIVRQYAANPNVHIQAITPQWDTCGAIGDQYLETVDQISSIVSDRSRGPWDIVMFGHSRGTIFNNEVAKAMSSNSVIQGNTDYVMTVLLDPTAARPFGDNYPRNVPSIVDRQIMYDDGHGLSGEAIPIAATCVSAVGGIFGGLSIPGCIVVGGVVGAVGSIFGIDAGTLITKDGIPINGSDYRNVHDRMHDEINDTGIKGVSHSIKMHTQIQAWYYNSDLLGQDMSDFARDKDPGIPPVFQVLPDLEAIDTENSSTSRFKVNYGQPITLSMTVGNTGIGRADDYEVKFYASANPKISTHDYLLGSQKGPTLEPSHTAHIQWSGTFPSSVPEGSYYLGWLIDSRDSEVSKRNNTGLIEKRSSPHPAQLDVVNLQPTWDEPNDTYLQATDLIYGPSSRPNGKVSGTKTANIHTAGESDWYSIFLDSFPESGSFVNISFLHNDGDLDFELYDADLTRVDGSYGFHNRERLDLSYLTPGQYYTRVFNYSPSETDYEISYHLGYRGLPHDKLEPNGSEESATFLARVGDEVRNQGTIDANISLRGSVHRDTDWYYIDVDQWAGPGSSLTLSYASRETLPGRIDPLEDPVCQQHSWLSYCASDLQEARELVDQGVLRFAAFPSQDIGPTQVFPVTESRDGNTVHRTIQIDYLPPGRHYFRVSAEASDINYYELSYDIQPTAGPPRGPDEPNDSIEEAAPVRFGRAPATIESPDDVDWFSFQLEGWGNPQNHVQLVHDPAIGHVTGELFDSLGRSIRQSEMSLTGSSLIDLNNLEPGTYFVRVNAPDGDLNAYNVLVHSNGTPIDDSEPNESPNAATSLFGFGTIARSIHKEQDTDWYGFELTSPGRIGNQLSLEFDRSHPAAQGDGGLELSLFDQDLQPINTDSDSTMSLYGLPPGNYLAQITGIEGGTNQYILHYDVHTGDRLPFVIDSDGSEVTAITTNEVNDESPLIDAGRIVWQRSNGDPLGNHVMFLDTNIPGARPRKLNDEITGNRSIHVQGGQAVWQGWDGHDWEIFKFDGTQVQQLTDNQRDDEYPRISKGRVVWMGWEGIKDRFGNNIAGDWEIFLHDGQLVHQITDNLYDDKSPQMNDNYVVWMGCQGNQTGDGSDFLRSCIGHDWEIFLNDGSSTRQLTDNSVHDWLGNTGSIDPVSQVENGRVAWLQDTGRSQVSQLFVHDGNSARPIFEGRNVFDPVVDEAGVAWQAYGGPQGPVQDSADAVWRPVDGDHYEIYTYDGNLVRQLTRGDGPGSLAEHPWFENGELIWHASAPDGKPEIFVYDGTSTRQLTDNDRSEVHFVISDGQVVWSDSNDGDRDIFLLDVAPQSLRLEFDQTVFSESESNQAIQGRVTRQNSDTYADLVVTLESSDQSEIAVASQIVIPAGQSSVSFDLNLVDDSLLDGTQQVAITANAEGMREASSVLRVEDYEPLMLEVEQNDHVLRENAGSGLVRGAVSRHSDDLTQSLLVTLSSSDQTEVAVPSTVLIPIGERSVEFDISVVDDNLLDGPQFVTLTASASGYEMGQSMLTVEDHESLTLEISQEDLSENAGVDAATLTVRRSNTDIGQPVQVSLRSSNPDRLFVPDSVVIPAGSDSAAIEIQPLDDNVLNGDQTVAIFADAEGYDTAAGVVRILDHENLQISISGESFDEGPATPAPVVTVSRSDIDDASLPVTVDVVVDSARVVVPESIEIPAGTMSVQFPVEIIDDSAFHDNQFIVIGVSAPGYEGANTDFELGDNDSVGVSVQLQDTTITEGSESSTLSVSLQSQPSADVILTLETDSQITTSTNVLRFTHANWNVPQDVSMTAVDDQIIEGEHVGTVSLTASSVDSAYDGIATPMVTVEITEGDQTQSHPPMVERIRMLGNNRRTTRILIIMSDDVMVEDANQEGMYRITDSGRDRRRGTADDRVITDTRPVYRAGDGNRPARVILRPRGGIPNGRLAKLTVDEALSSLDGSALDGDRDGIAGGDYVATIGRGNRFAFREPDRDVGVLALRRGGIMEFVRPRGAAAPEIHLSGTTTRSLLVGRVRPSAGGDGVVNIPQLTLDRNRPMTSRLRGDRFQIGPLTQDRCDQLLAASSGSIRAVLVCE